MKKWHPVLRLLAALLSVLLALPFGNLNAAAAAKTTTEIKHKSPQKYIPGFRINLFAEIEDERGVQLARCYFKTKKDEKYVFVDMTPKGNPGFQATLPAPWLDSEAVDYVFVVVNDEKKVTRSQVFTIAEEETKAAATWKEAGDVTEIRADRIQEVAERYEVVKRDLVKEYGEKLPESQQETSDEKLNVKTELEQPFRLGGLNDNFVVTRVSDSEKFGLLAEGLYSAEEIASAGGTSKVAAATGGVSAGTVTATGTGIGVLWPAIGAAVVAGGAAAAASGGGGGGGSSGGGGGIPVVSCSTQQVAGGDLADTRRVEVGQTSGTFQFQYQTYAQQDRITISYEGSLIFDTGCVGANATESVSFGPGSSTQVTVQVQPNCAGGTGTAWNYTVNCP